MAKSKNSRLTYTLVIGGGGNKGAAGAGKLAKIQATHHYKFDKGVGCSIGSVLLIPALLEKHKLIGTSFTELKQLDVIDDKNAFTKKGHVNWLFALGRIIKGKPTLSSSENLYETLTRIVNHDMWLELKNSGKEAVVAVYNDTTENVEYKSSFDYDEGFYDYEEFMRWVWVSACQPPIMSIYQHAGQEYVDGGVREVLPISEAYRRGAKNVVAIAHRPKRLPTDKKENLKNLFHHLARLLKGMRKDITNNDIIAGKDACEHKHGYLEIHYVSQGYGENDLIFDADTMVGWHREAYKETLNPEVVGSRRN